MHLAGCQINPIDVNVHFHIVLIKIQLTIYDPKGTRSENLKYLLSCYDSKYSLFWTFRAYLETLLETLNKALSSRMEMTRQLAILCTTTYRADMPSVTASYVQAQGSCMYVCLFCFDSSTIQCSAHSPDPCFLPSFEVSGA